MDMAKSKKAQKAMNLRGGKKNHKNVISDKLDYFNNTENWKETVHIKFNETTLQSLKSVSLRSFYRLLCLCTLMTVCKIRLKT